MDISNAWINGRTLVEALGTTEANHNFGKFRSTDRVKIQISRDIYALGIELKNAFPFVVEENLLITAHDVDSPSSIIDFKNIRFTKNALASATSTLIKNKSTQEVEKLGKNLDFKDQTQALKFSKEVCVWGRGQRVWGNLKRHYPDAQLGQLLGSWFLMVKAQSSNIEVITPGTSIKGLGISFASKHLRNLEPEQFAVLDGVLSEGLGYALNPAGFNLFISDLKQLKREHSLPYRIADLEASIFLLTRQLVRSK